MKAVNHSKEDEHAFMTDLLSSFDFDAVPSRATAPTESLNLHVSPLRIRIHSDPSHAFATPTKPKSTKCISILSTKAQMPPVVFDAGDVNAEEETAGWDWDACSDYVPTPQKPKPKSPTAATSECYVPSPCTRCTVTGVRQVWVDHLYEKHVDAKIESSGEARKIILRDDWADTNIHPGDTVNILGIFTLSSPDHSPIIILTSSSNLLIHHPDLLLTPTALSSAPHCTRRPILTSLLRTTSPSTPVLVYGNILHDVFQQSLRSGRWDSRWIENKVDSALNASLGELFRVGVSVETARREILDRARGVSAFGKKYIGCTPKREAILSNTRASKDQTSLLAISHLHDVEEDIWSPAYGLKGKLDASVEAIITPSVPPSTSSLSSSSRPVPFEIKTGRSTAGMEHRAQTMLYTLLMSERYCAPVEEGLLYYTQSEEVISVPAGRHEVRALIRVRNSIADSMARRFEEGYGSGGPDGTGDAEGSSFLPETIDDERICGRCFALDACMLYRKAVDNVEDDTSPIADIYALKTSHLTATQSSFFKSWERLIALEEHDMIRFRKELWTLGAREREVKGRCFADMVLDLASSTPPVESARGRGIHQFTYKFRRRNEVVAAAGSLLSGHISIGDAVSVSVEPDLLALTRGFVLDLSPSFVVLGVDHELSLNTIRERLDKRSRFRPASITGTVSPKEGGEIIFRIDKDELTGGMGRIRENLAQLFFAGGDVERLRLVVDLVPPIFSPPSSSTLLESARASPHCRTLTSSLNSSQLQAVEKVLCAENYACILGMPGTGKTTVVASLIKVLVEMDKTVLLSSYTHSAVDTILAKLKGADFGILRLGNVDKVHPNVFEFTLAARKKATNIEELERQLMTPPVVATTALSIDHELFSRRTFDYCIVDEASQITLPTCLGPLRFADKFILVGDHYQLSPLVRNRDARKGGLDVSLFRRLSEAHPHAVVDLTEQYRMNEHIMLLSNRLIYGDRLRCGSDEVAKQSLVLPNPTYLKTIHGRSLCLEKRGCWMQELMDENCNAIFVDTDRIPAFESHVGDLVHNEIEGALVHQLVETLLRCGIREEQLGVITLYRQQIKLLSHLLQDRTGVEILTADRSQGRDKDCIIISMVRSNDDGKVGDLVKDWRRMNVAFTRARSKLIIFGSRKTLQAAPLLAKFLELMDSQGWILQLIPGAHLLHAVPHVPETPSKRARSNTVGTKALVANEGSERDHTSSRPTKKMKANSDDGILRGRHILKDLVNDTL
ncbi:hypothetical protein EW146_g8137 [Bondarzewia mesenterica]|uniref:DNA replication ATP-dependent helicase/nuclease DNA2 n=1 Tax=Bondarzewia mesenterica TaxID=1095465 RepID=A0A4S4LGU7_9AGAM|nr:hypothetical protein EW146_g8137 [Bondarzewia mesenterica]